MLNVILDTVAGLTFNPWLNRHPRLAWTLLVVMLAGLIAIAKHLLQQ